MKNEENQMLEQFDFDNLGLYIGEGEMYGDSADREQMTELAAHLHEQRIYVNMSTFSQDVLDQTRQCVEQAGFKNVTVSKCEGSEDFATPLGVEIFDNGKLLARRGIEAYVSEEDYTRTLPNGDEASMLEYYDWDGYEKLEKLMAERDAEFSEGVEAIQTPAESIEQ